MSFSISSGSFIVGVRFSLPVAVMRILSSILFKLISCSRKDIRGIGGDSPDAAHVPVLVQHGLVNILGVNRVIEVRLNDEIAKVDLLSTISYTFLRPLLEYAGGSPYTWLNSNHASCGQRASHPEIPKHGVRVRIIRIPTRIVGVQAEVMSQPVGEEGYTRSRLKDLVSFAF
jgi:hypothetical protein